MATALDEHTDVRSRTTLRAAWALAAGGTLWFIGGAMHPKEDPPDLSVKEHLGVMFEDGGWYPSHALLLLGLALIAAALATLVRSGALAHVRPVQRTGAAAASAAAFATVAAVLHLVMATEAGRVAAGEATPIIDVQVVLETIAAPLLGLTVAALALVGASTRTIGSWPGAVLGAIGGVGYALAGATFLFTDALNALFPAAGLIGVWATLAGIGLIRRPSATLPSDATLTAGARSADRAPA